MTTLESEIVCSPANGPALASAPDSRRCWHAVGVWGDASCGELKKVAHCQNCAVYSQAASELLDQPIPAEYQREYTQCFSLNKAAGSLTTQSIIIFRIGSEWLGLPTRVLQEVAQQHVVHSIPHRRGGIIKGLVNIRGRLLVCIGLAELIGIETASSRSDERRITYERFLVVEKEQHRVVFPVQEVHGVHHFDAGELKMRPPPSRKRPRLT
jgi:chemotaxis-related protein WspD